MRGGAKRSLWLWQSRQAAAESSLWPQTPCILKSDKAGENRGAVSLTQAGLNPETCSVLLELHPELGNYHPVLEYTLTEIRMTFLYCMLLAMADEPFGIDLVTHAVPLGCLCISELLIPCWGMVTVPSGLRTSQATWFPVLHSPASAGPKEYWETWGYLCSFPNNWYHF